MFEPVVSSYQTGSRKVRRTVKFVANTLGYCRQYYYKHCKEQSIRLAKELAINQLLDKERKILQRLGGRKLYHQIRDSLSSKGLKMGRDGLFDILRKLDMLIYPRRRDVQTTMSKHWLRKYPNLFKNVLVYRADEVWVSDLTYIKTD